MISPQSTVLSLRGVSHAGRLRAALGGVVDFDLGHREVALMEIDDRGDTGSFIDVCLGLVEPPHGEVYCLGEAWRARSYREALARRGRIGTLVDTQVWAAHQPIARLVLEPRLYHTDETEDDAVAAATALARRFGLAGLPVGTRETMHTGDLVRAACVRAFLGAPEFVLIADPTIEGMGELSVAMAQAIGAVQDRGGAVLWLLNSMAAPAARFVAADHVLRLGDRGLAVTRRPS
jgi:phospholipid/cholesterol/gamma-HCH transport system ATP-binding protein